MKRPSKYTKRNLSLPKRHRVALASDFYLKNVKITKREYVLHTGYTLGNMRFKRTKGFSFFHRKVSKHGIECWRIYGYVKLQNFYYGVYPTLKTNCYLGLI